MEVQYRGSGKTYLHEKEYQCDLYYNEKQGGIILKINVKNEKHWGIFTSSIRGIVFMWSTENGFRVYTSST